MTRRLLLLSLLVGGPLAAQRIPPPLAAAPARVPYAAQRPTPPPTYWLEGAVIGAAGLGVLASTFAAGMCGLDDRGGGCAGARLGGAVIGASLGFTIGGLIGGQIPKRPRSRERRSIPSASGIPCRGSGSPSDWSWAACSSPASSTTRGR
jgi:hypothetical protein